MATRRIRAFRERFFGSVRRECLDRVLILGVSPLLEPLTEYARYFDRARTRQGIGQLVPAGFSTAERAATIAPRRP